ncbi:MAG: hypothetical protein GXY68_13270 [Chloroflexi bacterium]|jgi:hypothetical protein|nr:hypothetical protein [Chloroflexota bacterium]
MSGVARRWLAFLLAVLVFALLHEGAHVVMGLLFGEFEAFHVRPFGLEVTFRTTVAQRSGLRWALISGVSNVATVLLGYGLLWGATRLATLEQPWLRGVAFYLTTLCLLLDPLNLSIGPFIYGGDANGIAVGLNISRHIVQGMALGVLLVNRELVARQVLPRYGVSIVNPLLKPWLPGKPLAG